MKYLLCISIILGAIMISQSAHINNVNETDLQKTEQEEEDETQKTTEQEETDKTEKQIEALQKEKEDLFIQINKAIDEAIPELEKSNDTEAVTGLEHLRTLKQQIKVIHEEDSEVNEESSSEVNATDTDFRRKLSIKVGRKRDWITKQKSKKKNEFYDKLLKIQDKRVKAVVNRQKIAKQIEDWLKKRKEDKKKRKEYEIKMKLDNEKCPDYGTGKDRKGDEKRGKRGKSKLFPCCRKCCKRSYLGCL